MNIHREAFKEEAYEYLDELEACLLDLEETPGNTDAIERVFRALHTIKGSGGMFGFENIVAFTHDVETVFDLVRKGEIPVTGELVNLALSAGDTIKSMLDVSDSDDPADLPDTENLTRSLMELIPEKHRAADEEPVPGKAPEIKDTEKQETYRIRFRPDKSIFFSGTDPLALIDELSELGECLAVAYTENIPPLEDFDPEHCLTWWDIVVTTNRGINAIKDVFIFIEDDSDLRIHVIDEGETDDEPNYKRIGEILVERGDLSCDDLKRELAGQKRIGQILVEKKIVDTVRIDSALKEQTRVQQIRRDRREKRTVSSIRVPSARLDDLVNLAGELVTVQAKLGQLAETLQNEIERIEFDEDSDGTIFDKEDSKLAAVALELPSVAEEIERITGELRENTMRIRMLPIRATFAKFKRLVRDLSGELGKNVALVTEGGETELDKTMLDQLNDPLVHLIRNAIDHGIESPEIRRRAGKPKQGVIRLTARHADTGVSISVSDDGAGLDPDVIRSRAEDMGLIGPNADLSETELFALIFSHGFSTSEGVSDISGRGVGMDVVRQDVEAIRGTVEITGEKGLGQTTTLKLPLTLAIIDGLLVETGGSSFVFPLSAVEECSELPRAEADKARARNYIRFRDQALPYVDLREMLEMEGSGPEIEKVVIVAAEGRKVGIGVDRVVGHRQTVIKNLSKIYKDVEGLSGATILGDGRVALILDTNRLVRNAEKGAEISA